MESWRTIWRNGFVPGFSTEGLETLRDALASDDFRLLQGATTSPPPAADVMDWPADGACAIGYCGWVRDGLETVADFEEFFTRACYEADCRLGEPAACRWFLNWYDETPREEMRRALLAEVTCELHRRREADGSSVEDEFAEEVGYAAAAA